MPELDELLGLAERAAREAGALLLERFRRPATGVATKSSLTDPVSDADRDAERLLRRELLGPRPDDAMLGEEGGSAIGRSGYRWIVDPLDGTVNYLYGLPEWAVSVACEDGHGTAVGVVHVPVRGETFTAVRGAGARLDGVPIAVTEVGDPAQALIATGFSYSAARREVQARLLHELLPAVRDIRRGGCASNDLASVACGRVDGYYESGLSPWDWAAGALLVREAGGLVSALPDQAALGEGLTAAGPGVHEWLVRRSKAALAAL